MTLSEMDAIWNQIWPGTIADFPKYASSAAHVYGRRKAMSESFAAYRTPPDVKQAKWVTDHQFVRGINLFEWMYWPASTRGDGQPKGWFGDPEFPGTAQYANRVSFLLSNGRPASSIAVYYPTASEWMGDSKADSSSLAICRKLLENQFDFDFIDDYAILHVLTPYQQGLMNRSGQVYKIILIPSVKAMDKAVLDKLKAFSESGGKVVFTANLPTVIMERNFRDAGSRYEFGSMQQTGGHQYLALLPESDFVLEKKSAGVKYMHRKVNDGDLYFIFNEDDSSIETAVTLAGNGKVTTWNALTGVVSDTESTGSGNETVRINLNLKPWESKMVVVSDNIRQK